MALTRETFAGPWAGLPVAWTDDDRFDEAAYRENVANCCRAGVPGVYTGGTTGEFYAMELDEFSQVARATVEECHAHGKPAMVGCSSTYTRGAVRRATIAAELGADAVQLAMPFWIEIGEPQIVPFCKAVAEAAGLPLSIYDTPRSKRSLTLDHHRAIKEAVPGYIMVKATPGSIGAMPEGCAALAELVNVFVHESLWAELPAAGIHGCCSAMVYWNPRVVLDFWSKVQAGDSAAVEQLHRKFASLHDFLFAQFGPKGYTDTTYDRLAGAACGFLKTNLRNRAPYPPATAEDVQTLRNWCQDHFPEMLWKL